MPTNFIEEYPSYKGVYVVNQDVDLKGRTIHFPDGCTLLFKGGILRNGTIVGNNTRLKYKDRCLDSVEIRGTWLVPIIKSSIFVTNDYNNLLNLFNLQNERIHNDIIIDAGEYHINANSRRAALILKSNTTLQLNGSLILDPQVNDDFFNGYYAIYIYGAKDVVVTGNGKICGDLGNSRIKSEYGHGICVFASENVSISGITIKNVQGDGVAVSKNNRNIKVKDLTIDHFYRNGISIIDGENIQVENIIFSNGGETEPFAAVDVEPNEGDSIYNVTIKNLNICNCGVGLAGYVPNNAVAEKIIYEGVHMSRISRCCMNSTNFSYLEINNVIVEDCLADAQIMRFIGNQYLFFNKIKVLAPNSTAKYPFYINSLETTFKDCTLSCPQLFSFHLANTNFENTHFCYDSFLWTAANMTNKNLYFVSCVFDGPLFLRPNNVYFKNCVFKNRNMSRPYLVRFEEPKGDNSLESSVVMENNTFQIKGALREDEAFKCTVRNSKIGRFHFELR